MKSHMALVALPLPKIRHRFVRPVIGLGQQHAVAVFLVQVFFSSRRRHTRLQGDWSSDVCSSDLLPTGVVSLGPGKCMTAMTTFASSRTDAGALNAATPAAGAVPFVLNLCSSTTPMALAQTDLPELKRFTFVVSRRFEEGRERFRLHMGYFSTLAEAEEWLSVVREIYPGAWAGEAPGRKLRERATAAAAAQARHAAGPQPRIAPPPRRARLRRRRSARYRPFRPALPPPRPPGPHGPRAGARREPSRTRTCAKCSPRSPTAARPARRV